MRTKTLTLKNMVETLANASRSNGDICRISNMFYELYSLGFIGACTWQKFNCITDGWHFDASSQRILDSNNVIVWDFETDGV